MDKLTTDVKNYAQETLGARLVGVASVDRFAEAPRGHRPADLLPGAQAVVVVVLPILKSLLNWRGMLKNSEVIPEKVELPSGGIFEARTAIENHVYGRCCYESINNELQRITMHTAFFLEEAGYESTYMPITYGATFHAVRGPIPGKFGPFSHRHAAVAAGLGTLGINNLLLTEKFGAKQRLGSIITTAPLEPDPIYEGNLCRGEECLICVEECPLDIFGERRSFQMFGKEMPLASMNKDNCVGAGIQCGGTCMRVCPAGM
jgi:epoxyqueuosine reductase QueG